MSDVAIRVEQLGKQYKIGVRRARYRTLRESLSSALTGPFQRVWRKEREDLNANQTASTIWALKDVSFEVKQGEALGIIGRNGAGKSTLLKILSRITEPTEGCAEVRGRVGSLLEVGTGFHPELTGRENIYLNGAILGMKQAEIARKFDEIVAFAEVDKFVETPVKHYSSGMYMRLAFAVAAHLEPEILLVDEVLAVGDAGFQKKCLGKMGNVAKKGRTVLFVSHNMGAVSMLCNRVIYIAEGRLRAIGQTASIVTQYLTELFQGRENDLDQLRPPEFGKAIRFCDIKLASPDGINLRFGQPLRYALTIRSNVDMQELSLGCSIFNITGACVGTLFAEQTFSIKANQRLTLFLTVSNVNLAPGSYYAGFSIGRGGRRSPRTDFDMVIGKPTFQVLPLSTLDESVADWNPAWGNIVFTNVEVTPGEE